MLSSTNISSKLKNTTSDNKKEEPSPELGALPSGLYYIPNFITPEESHTFLGELSKNTNWVGVNSSQKSRRVIHYGYIYSYTGGPLQPTDPIPDLYQVLLGRMTETVEKCLFSQQFDQLIINEYVPGQGVSSHIDNTSKFGPIIACLSLGSGTTIQFTRPGYESFNVYVEPNSLYIMSGDARYLWKHAIAQRKTDLVNGQKRFRGTRISLTFRTTIV